jgi:hypothetical protein
MAGAVRAPGLEDGPPLRSRQRRRPQAPAAWQSAKQGNDAGQLLRRMTDQRRPDSYRFDRRRLDPQRLDYLSRTPVPRTHGPQTPGRPAYRCPTHGPKTRARRIHDRLRGYPARAPPIALRPPAADPAMPGRCSAGERDGRPESLAPWVAVQTWFRAWFVQTSSEPGPAVAVAEVLLQAVLQQAAHRRPGYQRAPSRQVGFAPVPGVSWPAEAVRMRAAWRRAGSVRREAGHPSEGDFVPLQSTTRSARPQSTQSRTAAVVVSPIHPQCATQAPAFTGKSRATLSPFSDKLGSLLIK